MSKPYLPPCSLLPEHPYSLVNQSAAWSLEVINLLAQRSAELNYHDFALRQEFAYWCDQSDTLRKPFAKHKSQIMLITTQLTAFLDDMNVNQVPANFESLELAYGQILGIYRIWSYFRSKLNMRRDDRLKRLLQCADELAWDCYKPAREKALDVDFIELESLKEPPLVFFSGDATPFAQARTTAFAPEGVSDRDIIDFAGLILSLPVPIVGVPWFQLNHLPALPVVAHEVGHAVEVDFQLKEPTTALIAGLDISPQRRGAWLSWRKEIFADFYACICMGPAYLLALIEYLQDEKDKIEKEDRSSDNWQDYPTRSLRIMLNMKILDELGLLKFEGEPQTLGRFLESLEQVWFDTYPQYLLSPFVQDMKTLVPTLLDAKFPAFGDTSLREVVQYDQDYLKNSWYLSGDILSNSIFPDDVVEKCPYRTLAAAPALAYARNGAEYLKTDVQTSVLQSLIDAIPAGTRAADPEDNQEFQDRKMSAAREKGRAMFSFF